MSLIRRVRTRRITKFWKRWKSGDPTVKEKLKAYLGWDEDDWEQYMIALEQMEENANTKDG